MGFRDFLMGKKSNAKRSGERAAVLAGAPLHPYGPDQKSEFGTIKRDIVKNTENPHAPMHRMTASVLNSHLRSLAGKPEHADRIEQGQRELEKRGHTRHNLPVYKK